jgi:ferritin-like metal-binding protein YciE
MELALSSVGKEGNMQEKTLQGLFLHELRDTYDAERQLTRALPKMVEAANSPDLREAFAKHLTETEGHVERLEEVFRAFGEKVRGQHCKGIAGIIEEGKSILEEDFDEPTMDAALIAAGQRAEHYEMAAYGTLIAWAEQMDQVDAARVLRKILEEEKAADKKLSSLAKSGINEEAGELDHARGGRAGVVARVAASVAPKRKSRR